MRLDRAASVHAANVNVTEAFDLMRVHYGDPRGARRRFGTVEAIASGHDVDFFNPVLALEPGAAPAEIVEAVSWIESLGLPASVVIDVAGAESITGSLAEHGLRIVDGRTAVMALGLDSGHPRSPGHPMGSPERVPGPDVTVRTGGIELAEAWWVAIEADNGLRATFGAGLIADPNVRIAVADLFGEPAAGAMAIRSGESLGVYAVWTAEKARRRGLGRAVTHGVVQAGHEAWGSQVAILHSTEMGFGVYRDLGFEDVGSVSIFTHRVPNGA